MPSTPVVAERERALAPASRTTVGETPAILHRCAAEGVGTFILVFFGTGAVHAAVLTGAQSGLWQVAVVWGIGVALAIHATATISGAHINPAMTAAFALFRGFPRREILPYWVAQLAGAMVAAALLYLLFGGFLDAREEAAGVTRGAPGSEITAMCYGEYFPNPGLGTDAPAHAKVPWEAAIAAEFIGTMVLAFVVFALTDLRNSGAAGVSFTPALIGLTVAALISVIAPLTQAGFNPARDFGPRLVAWLAGWGSIAIPGPRGGFFTVYVLAPILGAIAGGALQRTLLHRGYGSPSPSMSRIAMVSASLVGALVWVWPSLLAHDAALDPAARCTARRESPITYEVDLRAVVTAPYGTKRLQVWIPVPPSDDTQTVTGSRFETWPAAVAPQVATEPLYGNCFAYFEFERPQGGQMIRHTFRVTVSELRWEIDPARVAPVREWPASFGPYLNGDTQSVVVSDALRAEARRIVPASTNAALDLQRIFRWVEDNLTYDHSEASLRASAEWALERHRGHCSDYHGLCSAFGRALGLPARVAYGIHPIPKNSPSHCKAEVFLPAYGWVSFDVSETQRLIRKVEASDGLSPARKKALIECARRRLFSGFRDNTWFAQTRGTDYELVPPASRRVPVVRTLWAEADGVPLPDPDPGDSTQREFAWMTLHEYRADRPVAYPFQSIESLEHELAREPERKENKQQ